ncbi:MAG: ISAs1 family transposase [Pseudonocardiaceae bacterium]
MRAQSATSGTSTPDDPQPQLSIGSGAVDPGPGAGSCRDLLDALAEVVDPRKRRGIRHQLVSILALAAAAVVAGARSYVAAGQWAAHAPPGVLEALAVRVHPRTGAFVVPCESTIRRTLQACDGDHLDAVLGAWLYPRLPTDEVLTVDGETLRGAKAGDGRAVHVLAAMLAETRTVVSQRAIGHKTNEITAFAPLLDGLDLTGVLVSADALHTQRAHARFLVENKDADYLLTVKDNQPGLFSQLNALPWAQAPVAHTEHDRGHGRIERRTIQVLPAPDTITFPHAAQAFLIERQRPPRQPHLRSRGPRPDQPPRHPRRPTTNRHRATKPLEHRKRPALRPRRHLQRRRLPRPNRLRPTNHGIAAQPRHRGDPPSRLHQHRRRTAMGQLQLRPPAHHARPHLTLPGPSFLPGRPYFSLGALSVEFERDTGQPQPRQTIAPN